MSRFKRRESPTFGNQEELDCAVGGKIRSLARIGEAFQVEG